MWKEVVACFKVVFQNFSGGTGEKQKNSGFTHLRNKSCMDVSYFTDTLFFLSTTLVFAYIHIRTHPVCSMKQIFWSHS
jgi:hypothetical protein